MSEIGNEPLSKVISRRTLLIGAVIGLPLICGGLYLRTKGINLPSFLNDQPIPVDAGDLIFSEENFKYDGEAAKIISKVKKDYSISIISPKTMGENNELNLQYDVKDIELIAETLSQLPPEYLSSNRSPQEILLFREPGSKNEGAGGRYDRRMVIIFTPATFDADKPLNSELGKIYKTEGDCLKAAIIHEFTHSFIEAHPEIQAQWNKQTRWQQNAEGNWTNQNPGNLIHESEADKYPYQDIAMSVGLMLMNPDSLSKDRLAFFLSNQHFKSWSAVISFKQNHR